MTEGLSLRRPLFLFALALAVRLASAWPQTQPGYMDAAYYFDIADSIARGTGLTENFIWNYLSHPAGLPQPSNAYWMPLTSILVAPFLRLFGDSYRAAQVPMVLLSAVLVPVTYALSLKLFHRRDWAMVSAVLMLASSFYAPYWPAIDSFALFALLGTAIFWLCARQVDPVGVQAALLCGALVGLAHLTRPDGFLLMLAPLAVWRNGLRPTKAVIALFCGYLLVMLPWFARNIIAFGTPLPGGGTAFLRAYNDLFSYDQMLTFEYWAGGGIEHIVAAWLRALTLNLATFAGALCFVYFPFAGAAAWQQRRLPIVQSATAFLGALFVLATLIFSQSGPRGTFLHSLAALLPMMYALAPAGLAATVGWVSARRRTWNAAQAERVFGAAFMLMAIVLSGYLYAVNVAGSSVEAGWNERYQTYRAVNAFLAKEGGNLYDVSVPVMCINPPAYYYFSRRPAIALPTDDALALIHAAAAFGARFFILEPDHPAYLDSVYDFTVPDQRFQLRATFADSTGDQVQLYQIVPLR
jgi:4-amino-4-deoxy-L-arabinose transferase-like glycosyltransferase